MATNTIQKPNQTNNSNKNNLTFNNMTVVKNPNATNPTPMKR